MNYILLLLCILSIGVQGIFRKQFNLKADVPEGPGMLNFVMTLTTAVVMAFWGGRNFSFHVPTIAFGILFGLIFAVSITATVTAIKCGPLSFTYLLISFAAILPVIFGVIGLHEPLKLRTVIGLLLFCAALFFFNRTTAENTTEISRRWIFFALLVFFASGICSIIQKYHQVLFPGAYQELLIFTAMLTAAMANLLFYLFSKKSPKQENRNMIRWSLWYGIPNGIANAAANQLTLLLTVLLPASIQFPVISAGGIVCTFITSALIYKEKMSPYKIIGFIISIFAIAILN